jgi:hypothetical protein
MAATPKNAELWAKAHNVALAEGPWRIVKAAGSTSVNYVSAIQLILQPLMMHLESKRSQYAFEDHVFVDDTGAFTLQSKRLFGVPFQYYKRYLSRTGGDAGLVRISKLEYDELVDEAEALYGKLDWMQDFEPGLLVSELPVADVREPLY